MSSGSTIHLILCLRVSSFFGIWLPTPILRPGGRPHHAMLLSRRCAVCLALRHLAVVEPVLDNPWGPYESRQIQNGD